MANRTIPFKLDKNLSIEESWQYLIEWEQKSRDLIVVKKIYIDLVHDFITGVLLHQILYWNLPSKRDDTKLRVQKDGKLWLTKTRTDWWDEIRITAKQYDRAINILRDMYIVETQLYKFNGLPTVHICINKDILLGLLAGDEPRSRKEDEAEEAEDDKNQELKRGENGNYRKGKTGITEKGKPYKQRVPTESTLIKPKGFNQNSKTNFEKESINIDKPAEQVGAERKPINKAQMLKEKSKTYKPVKKPVKKRSAVHCKVSEENKPYFDILLGYEIKMPKSNTKIYARINECITQLRTGEFFNDLPGFERMYNRKITLDDLDRFCFHFTTMLGSKKYEPVNNGIKDGWRKWYFDRILYKEADSRSDAYSLFANLVDKPAREVKAQIKDANPEYTDTVIEMCKKEFGWDLSNGKRSIAIRCASRLSKFFIENKSRIKLCDYHYKYPHQQIQELLTMLDKNAYADHPPDPIYLCTDLTYQKLFPKHLKNVGSMD